MVGVVVTASWRPDALLKGYESLRLDLPHAIHYPGDPPGPLSATLVRRNPPTSPRAVLYVHGWNDYFFQTHVADYVASLGFDFYALDLRRFGRNLVAGMAAGFTTDLRAYAEELDLAMGVIRAQHDLITLVGHSLGGLVCALYADARPGTLNGLVLNAPWLANQAKPWMETGARSLTQLVDPLWIIRRPESNLYLRTMHADYDGEWRFDLSLKSNGRFKARAGWLRAVVDAHRAVRRGLAIDTPVLSVMSAHSENPVEWSPELASEDIVLNVRRIGPAALRLGRCVTSVKIEGALHDLTLSRRPVREQMRREVERWAAGYVL